jgi:hypothetical protein
MAILAALLLTPLAAPIAAEEDLEAGEPDIPAKSS